MRVYGFLFIWIQINILVLVGIAGYAVAPVGEFTKTRHPRNVGFNKVLETCFQVQGIRDFRKPGTYEASNSRICEVRGSWFGEEMESRTCGSPESWAVEGPNFGGRPIWESVKGWVRELRARTCANQRRSESQFGNLLKTQFRSFTRRHSRTGREAKSKLLSQKVRV
jgi:hypothetical protein